MTETRAVYAVADLAAIVSPYKSRTEERKTASELVRLGEAACMCVLVYTVSAILPNESRNCQELAACPLMAQPRSGNRGCAGKAATKGELSMLQTDYTPKLEISSKYHAELGERTAVQLYEPMTFNLLAEKYTPDFQHLLENGRVVYVEIKGSRDQKNYRDARSKLRAAAELHPWFTWIEARLERGGWTLERIG